MACIDLDLMSMYDYYNHTTHDQDDMVPEMIQQVDSRRPPQFNSDNNGCHAVRTCDCGANDDPDATVDSGGRFELFEQLGYESDTSSESGEDGVEGEEGTEGHLIEVGAFGLNPLNLIHATSARHGRYTCHHGIIPHSNDYPYTTHTSPVASGFASPTDAMSMIVEASSSDQSMTSSGFLSHPSPIFGDITFIQTYHLPDFPIVFNPLPLTPAVGYEYPLESSIAGSRGSRTPADFAEYDMW